MKITSERKIVAIALAVFVAFTTITHAVAVRSPERVLNGGIAVKSQLKSVAMKGPKLEFVGTTVYFVAGSVFAFMGAYYAYNGIGAVNQTAGQIEEFNVETVREYNYSNRMSPDAVTLTQDLP